ncbi:uncharacterized protein LOC143893695 [Temnothorax americanus]|uniref:uncharacterized protein LOC143893695 n=1 Tax=Temnothorax americanus TaxID=1964332 RepID=UPI0040682775
MTGCIAINCNNRSEKGFQFFRIPINVERQKKWLQNLNLRREQWISSKSGRVCEVHFEDSQFESRRIDGVRKLKPNAVPTLFYVPSRRIDSPPRKYPYKKLRSEVAGMCAQKVAEVPITPEMNMDYAAPSNHDVSNEVEVSSYMPKSLLSSDSEQTAKMLAGSSLEEENGHLQSTFQSTRVVADSVLIINTCTLPTFLMASRLKSQAKICYKNKTKLSYCINILLVN